MAGWFTGPWLSSEGYLVAVRLRKQSWAFSFVFPPKLSIERKHELQKKGVTKTCLLCLFSRLIWVRLSATAWGRAVGMTFWYSSTCPLHTPSALLVLRQLYYLQDHLPKPRATRCSLICKPECEPAGLRQRRLGQWSQCGCFVALRWLPLSRSHLRKSWAPGQDRWGMWTGNSQHEKS